MPDVMKQGHKPQQGVALAALLLWLGFYFIFQGVDSRWVDFPVFFEAGKKAFQGLTVYDVSGHFQFKYSPFIAALMGLFFYGVDFEMASFCYQKIIVFFWIFWMAYWVYRQKFKDYGFVLWFAIFVFFNALKLEIQLGQVNIFVLLLLTAALRFDEKREKSKFLNTVNVAICLSLAIQIKLYAALLLPLYFFRKQWGVLLLTFAAYLVTSIGFVSLWHGLGFAISENVNWLNSLTTSTDHLLLSHWNTSLVGFLGRLFGSWIALACWGLAVSVYLFVLYRIRNIRLDVLYAISLLAVVVLNPLVWSYWVIFLIPLFLLTLRHYGEELKPIVMRLFRENGKTLPVVFSVMWIGFQLQQVKLNLVYGIFVSVLCFLFLIRTFLVDQTAGCLRVRNKT